MSDERVPDSTLRMLRIDYGDRAGPNSELENADADEDVIAVVDELERLRAELDALRDSP